MSATKPPVWAQNLTQRLLAEAPESMAFWEIMASAIANERERCAHIAEKYKGDWRAGETDKSEYGWGKARSVIADRIRRGI